MWTSDAPASNAWCVDSICSVGVTGTAGLSFLRGNAPVIATVMMTGSAMDLLLGVDSDNAPQRWRGGEGGRGDERRRDRRCRAPHRREERVPLA